MAPQYKLSYFNIRGLAEHIRMLLLDQGIEFTDDQFSREEWYEGGKKKVLFHLLHIRMLLLDQGIEFTDDQFSREEWYEGGKKTVLFHLLHIRMLLLDQGIEFTDDQFSREEWYEGGKKKVLFHLLHIRMLLLDQGIEFTDDQFSREEWYEGGKKKVLFHLLHIRMLLLDQGIEFTDDQFSREEWYEGGKKKVLFHLLHIRMLLLDQGIEFTDDQFSREEWYEGGKKKEATFGQCPWLTEGERQIAQNGTIMRHLARVHGIYGTTEEEKTLLDMVADGAHDLRLKYYQIIYREFEKKDDFIENTLPGQLEPFEKILSSRPNPDAPFLIGESIAYTDYILWELLECLVVMAPNCLESFPRLKAYHGGMAGKRPRLAEYLASDKRKNLPLNNNGRV